MSAMISIVCVLLAVSTSCMPWLACAEEEHKPQWLSSPLGMRRPQGQSNEFTVASPKEWSESSDARKKECNHEAHLCVGPSHDHYPLGHEPGVLFTARFRVPPLPKSYNSQTMTYYDYFNIFWRQQPKGGFMNQFVPQLMLGNVLANSSNYPDYEPKWLVLDEWHIGAQYFFALPCNTTSEVAPSDQNASVKRKPCWKPKAATGKLIPVKPGELVETTFTLVQVTNVDDWEWHLQMGVVGAHPNRWSLVVSRVPFMGLVKNTKWQDDNYQNVTVGSCLENYNMYVANNYPSTWQISMDVIAPAGESRRVSWDDWRLAGDEHCSWQPKTTLASVDGSSWQRVIWNATLTRSDHAQQ
ncbi:expressed unknown protein [Seminavis robusta]|uniref:Uncharacterized protein n=1 Tax=Seminavis robusta TaxID=568900 RepID=A0A9N8D7U6_9STRA|nr:expressed unknown protein [Seminavis robusta]|eukprot:Sro9_g007720.1 n/a (355) ;mRNA; r:231085-232256